MIEPLSFDVDCISAFLLVDQGNTIWTNMIARRRKLGYATFYFMVKLFGFLLKKV